MMDLLTIKRHALPMNRFALMNRVVWTNHFTSMNFFTSKDLAFLNCPFVKVLSN